MRATLRSRARLGSTIVRPTSPQTITNNTFGPFLYLSFDVVDVDQLGMWDAAEDDRLTVQTSGIYVVTASWAHVSHGGSAFDHIIQIETTPYGRYFRYEAVFESSGMVVCTVPLEAGDIIRVAVYHNTGASRDTLPTECHLAASRIA